MAIPRFDEDLSIISKLGDNPGSDNNLTTDAFRAKFDEGPLKIQQYLNEVLIPAAEQSSSPQEGLAMEGPINMNGQKLTGIPAPVSDDDAVNWGSVKNAQGQHQNEVITLSASKWSNKQQTVSVAGLSKDDTVFSTPDADSSELYSECNVKLKSQGSGTLTYVCEEVPSANLTINVSYFPVGGTGVAGGGSTSGGSTGGGTGGVSAEYVEELINAAIPPVTAEDNGKFLRVVDGAWAAVTVPSAEGVGF